jgi:hypothetical protein
LEGARAGGGVAGGLLSCHGDERCLAWAVAAARQARPVRASTR